MILYRYNYLPIALLLPAIYITMMGINNIDMENSKETLIRCPDGTAATNINISSQHQPQTSPSSKPTKRNQQSTTKKSPAIPSNSKNVNYQQQLQEQQDVNDESHIVSSSSANNNNNINYYLQKVIRKMYQIFTYLVICLFLYAYAKTSQNLLSSWHDDHDMLHRCIR
jgi:ABC-type antimicrobial peptide transport system permease subunit